MSDLIRDLYLFRQLDDRFLDMIGEISTLRHFGEEEEIFKQGSDADSLFVIQHGIVRIDQELADNAVVEVATLATGSHFGEIAFLDSHPRSGTATSVTRSDILEILFDDLQELMNNNDKLAVHVYQELARFLSSRLRLTTLDLTYSRSYNISHF